MTDDRPEPRYGQYAPVPPAAPSAASPASPPAASPAAPAAAKPDPGSVAPVAPQRRTGDIVITTALLLFGVWDVVAGLPRFADLASALRLAYEAQGVGEFTSDALAGSMGIGINIARVVLLVAAISVSLVLISRGRRAFWVPLAAAAAGALIIFVFVIVVVTQDPAFLQYVNEQSTLL